VRLDPAGLYLLPGRKPRDDVAEMLSARPMRIIAKREACLTTFIIDALAGNLY